MKSVSMTTLKHLKLSNYAQEHKKLAQITPHRGVVAAKIINGPCSEFGRSPILLQE
jgi:hypothetical protein